MINDYRFELFAVDVFLYKFYSSSSLIYIFLLVLRYNRLKIYKSLTKETYSKKLNP